MTPVNTLDLVARLCGIDERLSAAQALASHLGVEEILLFIQDADVGVLVPAPGFPQTLRGGRSWRVFLKRCGYETLLRGVVEYPPGRQRSATAFVQSRVALVALSQEAASFDEAPILSFMPILAALLTAEHTASIAQAQAADARTMVIRFEALAMALESARAETSKLNAELRALDRQKDEFLAMLGHELRSPLAALMNAVTLLQRQSAEQPLPARVVDSMSRQIVQLRRLVDDLLDVSRVSRGRIHLQLGNVCLASVLEESLEEIKALAADRRHQINKNIEMSLPVFADRARLLQIFGNLLNNAAKYTPVGGTLWLKASQRGDEALVELRDNGIGISPELLPKVFDLFAQATGSLELARGGLGIGLTLVKRLVEMHQGEITIASPGVNQGTTVSVRLPLSRPTSLDTNAAFHGVPPHASVQRLRVLVVDDNQDVADTLRELLEISGQSVVSVYGAHAALEAAARERFDLILLDIGLPTMSGAEVARRLRTTGNRAKRIVALSGFGEVIPEHSTDAVHFDERFVKPISFDALQELLVRSAAD